MIRKSKIIKLANLNIGKNNPIYVQSMTNVSRFGDLLKQVKDLQDNGCEIIRISVPDIEQLNNFFKIKAQIKTPLIADIHFDYKLACECIKKGADGIRINPGNIGSIENYYKIIDLAKIHKTCIRIGVNSGSLEKEILNKYGKANELALVESALKWIDLTNKANFSNFKVSIKSSNMDTFVKANKLLNEKTDVPIHIGLTEAGTLISGLIKSTLAISELLKSGIGDTIRISLSSNPIDEVISGIELLKALNYRKGIEIISCPTCSRTNFDIIGTAAMLQKKYITVAKNAKIAVMGCVVNGPGEAKEADIGIAGAGAEIVLFKKGIVCAKIDLNQALIEIDNYIQSL